MPETLDPLEKARLRQLKIVKEREQAEAREKAQTARIRTLERQTATRQGMLIGTTIRDEKLTENERLVIAGILNRRKEKPSDWYKIKAFTDVSVLVITPPEDADLGSYIPSRSDKKTEKKGENLDAAE
jgi:hypothetical protein